jgi:twinkle protein
MDDNVIRFPKGPCGLVSLRDLPEPPPVIPWYAGYPEFRHKMQLASGMLSVVTGHPGHGKTSLMAQLWFNMVSNHNLQITVASFESSPVPAYRKMVRQFWAGLPQAQMTDEQIRAADAFTDDHYKFLIDEHDSPTLDWIYDKIFDHGNEPDVLVIDPWNRVESKRGKDQTETDYILRSLIDLRVFAKDNNLLLRPSTRLY